MEVVNFEKTHFEKHEKYSIVNIFLFLRHLQGSWRFEKSLNVLEFFFSFFKSLNILEFSEFFKNVLESPWISVNSRVWADCEQDIKPCFFLFRVFPSFFFFCLLSGYCKLAIVYFFSKMFFFVLDYDFKSPLKNVENPWKVLETPWFYIF